MRTGSLEISSPTRNWWERVLEFRLLVVLIYLRLLQSKLKGDFDTLQPLATFLKGYLNGKTFTVASVTVRI